MKLHAKSPDLPVQVWIAIPIVAYLVWRLWPMLSSMGKGVDKALGGLSWLGETAGQGVQNIMDLPETLRIAAETRRQEAKLAEWNRGASARTEKWRQTVLPGRLKSLADSIDGDKTLAREMARDYADAVRVKYQQRALEIATDFTDVGSDVALFL